MGAKHPLCTNIMYSNPETLGGTCVIAQQPIRKQCSVRSQQMKLLRDIDNNDTGTMTWLAQTHYTAALACKVGIDKHRHTWSQPPTPLRHQVHRNPHRSNTAYSSSAPTIAVRRTTEKCYYGCAWVLLVIHLRHCNTNYQQQNPHNHPVAPSASTVLPSSSSEKHSYKIVHQCKDFFHQRHPPNL